MTEMLGWRQLVLILAIVVLSLGAERGMAQTADGLKVYIVENGQAAGPFDMPQLRRKASDGVLTPNTLVWMDGMPDWDKASNVTALSGAFPLCCAMPPERDYAKFVLGTWKSEVLGTELEGVGPATVEVTFTFGADGLFQSLVVIRAVEASGQAVTLRTKGTGTYTVIAEQARAFDVKLLGTDVSTVDGRADAGTPGRVDMTIHVEVQDQNTIIEDGNLYRRVGA